MQKIEFPRNDDLRDGVRDYETILFNPKLRVLPSIIFDDNDAPMIMTCRIHNRGTVKKYLHPPQQPFHNLPSIYGDQLVRAVIKTWSLRPIKATKYINTFQIHEQRGCFQGIDTCNITNFGDFSKTSAIIDEK